jgi:hypothetical protein
LELILAQPALEMGATPSFVAVVTRPFEILEADLGRL